MRGFPALLVVLLLASPPPVHAQGDSGSLEAPQIEPVCPAPVSVCSTFHLLSPDAEYPIFKPCPDGFTCACVPSCPLCRDCAVQVCVPDGTRPCRTACDCEPGLGCFDGRCIAGFAPVFCCEAPECPAGEMCQHLDGTMGRCAADCSEELWLCDPTTPDPCGPGRACGCTASCPLCEDCGPNVCAPLGSPTPYRCREGMCASGDRCVCVSSCPACDDCALSVCVPRCDGPSCEERARDVTRRIEHLVQRASRCTHHDECVLVSTSTECRGTCGAWVNEEHAAHVRKRVARLSRRICSGYLAEGCPVATPACMLERGLCVDRRCRGIPVLPSPVPPDMSFEILEQPADTLLSR